MEKLMLNYSVISAFIQALFWKIVIAIVVYIIGKWAINKVCKISTKMMDKKGVEDSLQGFLESIIKVGLWLCLIIAIINILGVDTAAFVGLFAGAGVAIGMAMSGTLGNFALATSPVV